MVSSVAGCTCSTPDWSPTALPWVEQGWEEGRSERAGVSDGACVEGVESNRNNGASDSQRRVPNWAARQNNTATFAVMWTSRALSSQWSTYVISVRIFTVHEKSLQC